MALATFLLPMKIVDGRHGFVSQVYGGCCLLWGAVRCPMYYGFPLKRGGAYFYLGTSFRYGGHRPAKDFGVYLFALSVQYFVKETIKFIE